MVVSSRARSSLGSPLLLGEFAPVESAEDVETEDEVDSDAEEEEEEEDEEEEEEEGDEDKQLEPNRDPVDRIDAALASERSCS